MSGNTSGETPRLTLPNVIACLVFVVGAGLALWFSLDPYNGPPVADKENRKRELLADRTALMLQLSKCRGYAESKNDAYNCPGVNVMYTVMAGSDECKIVEEAAKEAGVADRVFSIPLGNAAASPPAQNMRGYLRGGKY